MLRKLTREQRIGIIALILLAFGYGLLIGSSSDKDDENE